MFHYYESITDVKGNALTGYYVGVVTPDPLNTTGGTDATIYADDAGTPIISASGVTNRAKVDPDGNVSFFVPTGDYHLDVYAPDAATKIKRILDIPMESGQPGISATITIGTTTTLSAGSSATVTNSGSASAAILNFGIPMGATGSGTSFAWGAATGTLSNQTDLQNALNLLAPIASPSFTGTPLAPTPVFGDNSTKIATTAFVQANAATLSSPAFTGTPTSTTAAQDTNTVQIATCAFVLGQANSTNSVIAMNGAQNAGTSVRYARADHVHPTDTSLAPLASPALTGAPTAPTATAGTNTNQIATTAFVATAIGAVSDPWKVTKLTSDVNTASATLVTTGLTVAGSNFVANSYYEFEGVVTITGPGNGDVKIGIVWPSGVTGSASIVASTGASSAAIVTGNQTATLLSGAIGQGIAGPAVIRGQFYTGSLAATGNLDIQFEAVAGTVTCGKGSLLRYRAL